MSQHRVLRSVVNVPTSIQQQPVDLPEWLQHTWGPDTSIATDELAPVERPWLPPPPVTGSPPNWRSRFADGCSSARRTYRNVSVGDPLLSASVSVPEGDDHA